MQNVPGGGDGTSPRGTGEFSLAVAGDAGNADNFAAFYL